MKTSKIECLIAMLLFSVFASAQLSDIARLDYTTLPKGNSNLEYERMRFLFNYPIKLNENKTYLFLGLDYSNINLNLDESPFFDEKDIDQFQIFDVNIAYTSLITKDWRWGIRATPRFSTSRKFKEFKSEDFSIGGQLIFLKDMKDNNNVSKPYRLLFGLSYSSNSSVPYPLPLFSYFRQIHPKWSYSIGVPKTNLQYYFSESNRLKLFAQLDGFNSDISDGFLADGLREAKRVSMTLIISGLQYEYYITDHIQLYARGAYILNQSVKLRDKKSKKLQAINADNKLYLRTGIRLKI